MATLTKPVVGVSPEGTTVFSRGREPSLFYTSSLVDSVDLVDHKIMTRMSLGADRSSMSKE